MTSSLDLAVAVDNSSLTNFFAKLLPTTWDWLLSEPIISVI